MYSPDRARRARPFAAFAALFFCFASHALLASMATGGQVRGRVLDPDGKPLPGVSLALTNEVTGYRQATTSGPDGVYLFYNVPYNPYHLSALLSGFATAHEDLDVRGTAPVRKDLRLLLGASASATVSAEREAVALETDTATTHIDIDRSLIRRAPAAVASRAFEALITSTPGFSADENGRYHFQGGHSQQLLVIDGQPIGDQVGVTFSNSLDPNVAENLEIVTGGIPAEYGEKANGVINLTTRSGLGLGGVKGDVAVGGARFSTYEAGASAGGGSSRFGWFVNLNGSRSDRFLDPVTFENLHNVGSTQRGFLRLDSVSASGSDAFRLTASLGRTSRDVTNLPSQEEAGQDQNVLSTDWNLNLGYQHVAESGLVVEAQVYGRDNRLTLYSSPNDTPVRVDQNRSLENQGINLALSKQIGVHELKVGAQAKRFPIRERFAFGITDPALNDPEAEGYNPNLTPYDLTRDGTPFRFEGAGTGTYVAAFVQDTLRLGGLTVNAGLRFDHNRLAGATGDGGGLWRGPDGPRSNRLAGATGDGGGLWRGPDGPRSNRLFESENQLQPRIGLAYFVEPTKTVLRASYDRMFITPEYENILLGSSAEAAALAPPEIQESRELGFGRLNNVSERHDAYNVGVQQGIGSALRVDLSYWRRDVTNAADQGQLFNTGIVFPLNFKGAKLSGWNARLDLAPVGGVRGYLSVGHVKATYTAPFVGGLFLDAEAIDSLTGGDFVIDHDQDLQEQAGLFFDVPKTGFWLGLTQRYDSGLVADAGSPEDVLSSPDTAYADPYLRYDQDPQRVKSRTVWSFSLGARLQQYGLPLELQLDVLNAFDARGLYNFQSVFGGTHVIPPRTVAGRVKVVF